MRFQAGLACHGVQRDFQCEAYAGSRDAAIGQDRRLVRRGGEGAAAISLHRVRAGQDRCDLRRFKAGGEWIGGICTGIDHRFGVDANQRAVGFGVQRDVVVVLTTIGIAGELFAPILDPAHRMAEQAREEARAHFLGQQDALVAEAAADIGGHDANARLIQPETTSEARADDVWELRGGIDQQLLEPTIPGGDDTAAFQR